MNPLIDSRNTGERPAPPFWLPLLAGLPISLCLIVMALPVLGHGHASAYRTLYFVAYLAWTVPLTVLQRALWRRYTPWWAMALVLLSATYLMSLANNALGVGLAVVAGWGLSPDFRWTGIFSGLEGCWLALVAFCAIHAVVAYYAELKQEQALRVDAVSLAREAELKALRYQLQPHFLFNTLNAISALVVDGRPREAQQMIARLGDFLRATLDGASGHEVTLADELALTETYLEIEKARLGDRLVLKWHVGADLLRARVPYLLLQPLVENAVRHGIAPRSEPGHLDIRWSRDGDRLLLRLGNDTAAVPGAPDAGLQPAATIGLRNVRERLARLYPGQHQFHAGSRAGGGYEVQLGIPFREMPPVAGLAAAWT